MSMDAYQQEARISLAIQEYKQGQFKIHTAAAKAFDVPKNTVLRRLQGTPAQRGAIAATRLLTPNEEDALIEWVYQWIGVACLLIKHNQADGDSIPCRVCFNSSGRFEVDITVYQSS
jgi:hypothetical protein